MASEFMPATHLRRLGALFYDLLIAVFIPIILSGIIIKEILVPLGIVHEGGTDWIGLILMLLLIYAYFAFTWVKYGQTIGLRTWRLKLISDNGGLITMKQAGFRFITAIPSWAILSFGLLGQLGISKAHLEWSFIPPVYLTIIGLVLLFIESRPDNWRDRLTRTRVIRLA